MKPRGRKESESVGLVQPKLQAAQQFSMRCEQLPRLCGLQSQSAEAVVGIIEQTTQPQRILLNVGAVPVSRKKNGDTGPAVANSQTAEFGSGYWVYITKVR